VIVAGEIAVALPTSMTATFTDVVAGAGHITVGAQFGRNSDGEGPLS
jgi:hypothetical protein